MKKTISQTVTAEMEEQGFRLVGKTSGWYTFRKGSNLARCLEQLNLTEEQVDVRTGARAGKNKSEGHELLIFVKEALPT